MFHSPFSFYSFSNHVQSTYFLLNRFCCPRSQQEHVSSSQVNVTPALNFNISFLWASINMFYEFGKATHTQLAFCTTTVQGNTLERMQETKCSVDNEIHNCSTMTKGRVSFQSCRILVHLTSSSSALLQRRQ